MSDNREIEVKGMGSLNINLLHKKLRRQNCDPGSEEMENMKKMEMEFILVHWNSSGSLLSPVYCLLVVLYFCPS